ncbi:uncharacterized protein LOC143111427 [Alosa pseudoharengus]|uniref:uncharacterized protein LOC143111427 n=1 Tax=Alosa pseudoharengus TaxID=34774 RepID=UPI003F8BCD3F
MIGLFCGILPSPLHTDMQAVFLLLLLAGASKGLDSICDATRDAACYGALGGPVYLLLTSRTSGHDLRLSSRNRTVFRFRKFRTVFHDEFNTTSFLQRWQFVPDNWTLMIKINPAERRDSGTYRVEVYEESTGMRVGDHRVQLIIDAPVSDVNLSVSCSANGKRRARCSSNGDSPQYSWFLDGQRLSEADLRPDNQTLLNVTGELTCSVRNHVSSANTSAQLVVCSAAAAAACSPVFISAWLAQFIILTSLLVGGHCLHVRNKRLHTPDECEDQELELTLTSKSHIRRSTIEEVQMQ